MSDPRTPLQRPSLWVFTVRARLRSALAAALLVIVTIIAPHGSARAAAVTVAIPTNLTIVPGGDVVVPVVLTNDVQVWGFLADIHDGPDELALVAGSSACSTRAPGTCAASVLASSDAVRVLVFNTSINTITPGDGAVMTLTLHDGGTPCTPGTFIDLTLSNVAVSDPDNQELPATAVNGKVQCGGETPTPTATVTSTPTPTATSSANPGPTASATVTVATTTTASATRTATPTIAVTPTIVVTPLVALVRAKAVDQCQKAINKAGGQLVAKKLKAMESCAGRLFKCIQTKAPGAKRAQCVAKAATKCTAVLGAVGTAAEPALRSAIRRKCGGFVLLQDVLEAGGIGYVTLATDCQTAGFPLASVADVASCIAAHHECRAERLFELRAPRAGELMRIAGVSPAVLGGFSCLTDHGGAGTGSGDPQGTGKALDKCSATVGKASTQFVTKKLKSLEKCVDLVFSCVQLKPTDAACITKATTKCDVEFGRIATAEAKLRAAVLQRCADGNVSFATLAAATGAGLDAVAGTCSTVGVAPLDAIAPYATCVTRQHECLVEELLLFEAPRADELLQRVGRELTSPFCK